MLFFKCLFAKNLVNENYLKYISANYSGVTKVLHLFLDYLFIRMHASTVSYKKFKKELFVVKNSPSSLKKKKKLFTFTFCIYSAEHDYIASLFASFTWCLLTLW